MKVIITGASGFIGRNLIRGLPKVWDVCALYHTSRDFPLFVRLQKLKNVQCLPCDLTNEKDVAALVRTHKNSFDVCVYLSANGDPALSVKDPLLDLNKNTVALVNFLTRVKVKKFIFFSSGAVYDGLKGAVSPQTPVDPRLPYAISKFSSELYIKAFAQRGLVPEYVILRFFGAFGPYEPVRKIYTKLVKTFYLEMKNEFTVTGDGENLIDAMCVQDAVGGILKVIESKKVNETVDFCSGTALSINDLVKTAAKVFKREPVKIRHEGKVPEYILFRASPEKMNRIFNFKPKMPLSDGFTRLAEFLEKEKIH